jgi:hypothetical protein
MNDEIQRREFLGQETAKSEIKKHSVWVVHGETACKNFFDGKVVSTQEDVDGYAKKYEFDTEIELEAFKKGISVSTSWFENVVIEQMNIEVNGNLIKAVSEVDEIEKDNEGNCIYCGQKCFDGQMCDEQQAGGFGE